MLTANEYQMKALRTANRKLNDKELLLDGLMGLNGEAGEAIDLLKKHLFQGHPLDEEHLAKELGDIAWYLAEASYALGYSLETIFRMNLLKLAERYPEGFSSDRSLDRKEGDI